MMGTRSPAFETPADMAAWCERAPAGTHLDVQVVADVLNSAVDPEAGEPSHEVTTPSDSWTWRERLWTVPAETRLGVAEVAEALGRGRPFVYARTGAKAEKPIPHRKLDGTLLFTAGELRAWIRDREAVLVAGRSESTASERSGQLHAI
jgi:hypothetical protein